MVKNLPASAGDHGNTGSIPVQEDPLEEDTPVFLPGKFHGQRSVSGYSPWGCKESDMTEHTHNLY